MNGRFPPSAAMWSGNSRGTYAGRIAGTCLDIDSDGATDADGEPSDFGGGGGGVSIILLIGAESFVDSAFSVVGAAPSSSSPSSSLLPSVFHMGMMLNEGVSFTAMILFSTTRNTVKT